MHGLVWYKGLILGIIQGATEFFPVSSSAHLVIAQSYLGVHDSARVLYAFDTALHFGTLIAAIIFFRWDLACLFTSWVKPWRVKLEQKAPPSPWDIPAAKKISLLIILGIIPAGLLGAVFHQFFEDLFNDTLMVALFMMITGVLIYSTRDIKNNNAGFGQMGFKQALLIGLAQVASILPGISRSGATISAGLFFKLKPETAFRFSFLMMVPLAAGSVIMDLKEFAGFPLEAVTATILGSIAAGVVGFNSLKFLLKLMEEGKFPCFAYYCWAVGGLVMLKEIFL